METSGFYPVSTLSCTGLDELLSLLDVSGKTTDFQVEKAAAELTLFTETLHHDIACADERNRVFQGEVVALRGRVKELGILHERQEGSLREEVEAGKAENARLREEIARITREADERIRILNEEKVSAVQTAVLAKDAEASLLLQETHTLRQEAERLRVEAIRQKTLADAEKEAAQQAERQTRDVEATALKQKLEDECKIREEKEKLYFETERQTRDSSLMEKIIFELHVAFRGPGMAYIHDTITQLSGWVIKRRFRPVDLKNNDSDQREDTKELTKILGSTALGIYGPMAMANPAQYWSYPFQASAYAQIKALIAERNSRKT